VLAFSLLLASCGKAGGDDTDDTGAQTGNGTITGGTSGATISVAVKYDSGIPSSLLTEAKSKTNFSYFVANDPISNYIPNSSVTVSNGNVTIKLGIPSNDWNDWMEDMSYFIENGLTVSDPSAKISDEVDGFSTQDGKYWLELSSTDENKSACLFYATKDVTITGSRTNSDTYATYTWTSNYNISLKAGWNYWIAISSGTEYNRTYTNTASQSLPSGFSWTVFYSRYYEEQLEYAAIEEKGNYLASQPANSQSNPYTIAMQLKYDYSLGSLGYILRENPNKYVKVDLTGSTITAINGFNGCTTLTGITIPSSVTSIEPFAFGWCENLTSVTFKGSGSNLDYSAFGAGMEWDDNTNTLCEKYYIGDLREKYLAGGIGTYTRAANGDTWTKQ
jgi:hypothetical protein